jgi:ubiquinone/menaquinone biosynthesis C-methylase UbiE/DNA-binding transcriptional ArsR family regulator
MPQIVKILRVVADPNRLRILLLLDGEELSVAELQEILVMGQSTISTHLSQLKQAGLVEDRRTGKNNLYRLAASDAGPVLDQPLDRAQKEIPEAAVGVKGTGFSPYISGAKSERALAPEGNSAGNFLRDLLARAMHEIPEAQADQAARRRVVKKRQDKMRSFFDSVAGRLGRNYVPGKSWKSLAEALLRLMPPVTVADLGAGEGSFALLLAQRAVRVIAVDTSARMIEVAREEAQRNGVKNVDYRLGDMEELPIANAEVDVVFFSQSLHHALHPARALEEAARILTPGGRIVILDLAKHRYEEAREMYADEWLGFTEAELESLLQKAGFTQIEATIVDKETESPQFQTLLAVATKPQ